MPTRRWLERALRDCANRADWVARSQEVAIPKKGGGTGMHREHKKFTFVLLMHRSLIRNTSSVGDHGRSPLLPMLRDGRSQQIAFAPDAPHQEITADRLCSRCSRISVLMEMREQICSRSILLCRRHGRPPRYRHLDPRKGRGALRLLRLLRPWWIVAPPMCSPSGGLCNRSTCRRGERDVGRPP